MHGVRAKPAQPLTRNAKYFHNIPKEGDIVSVKSVIIFRHYSSVSLTDSQHGIPFIQSVIRYHPFYPKYVGALKFLKYQF